MAAILPPAPVIRVASGILGGPLLAGAPLANFMQYYADASQDEYNRQYDAVMGVFAPVPGGPSPQQIRELVVNNPRESYLGFATLLVPAHNPAHPGLIYAIHLVTKFAAQLGQPATQWDNRLSGSIDEVVGNQNPATIELPVDAFSRQNGGNLFRVAHPQRMVAMYGADPALELLGEFANFDAGTELVQSRNMVLIPHRYMRHFLNGPLTPRQAWEVVGYDIILLNDAVSYATLLTFLRLACVRNTSADTALPLTPPELSVPLADAVLVQNRTDELIAHKLPGLNGTPILAAGQQVAQSLGELVAEQLAVRQDQLDRHMNSTLKTIEE
jgi:hypothetical protein